MVRVGLGVSEVRAAFVANLVGYHMVRSQVRGELRDSFHQPGTGLTGFAAEEVPSGTEINV